MQLYLDICLENSKLSIRRLKETEHQTDMICLKSKGFYLINSCNKIPLELGARLGRVSKGDLRQNFNITFERHLVGVHTTVSLGYLKLLKRHTGYPLPKTCYILVNIRIPVCQCGWRPSEL